MSEKENIQRIIERIQADAAAQVQAIRAEMQREVDAINSEAQQSIASDKASMEEEFSKETARIGKRMNSASRLEAKRMMLQAREGVIEDVLHKVAEKLRSMPPQDYKAFLQTSIRTAKGELGDDLVVHCKQKDRDIVKAAGAGVRMDFRDLTRDAIGGMMIESKKTGAIMNFLFDDIMERELPRLREEIGKVLYKDSGGAGSGEAVQDDIR